MISKDRATALSPLDLIPAIPSTPNNAPSSANKDVFDSLLRGPKQDSISSNRFDRNSNSNSNSTSNRDNDLSGSSPSNRSTSTTDDNRSSRRTDSAHDNSSPAGQANVRKVDDDHDDDSTSQDEEAQNLAGAAGVNPHSHAKAKETTEGGDAATNGSEEETGTAAVGKSGKRLKKGAIDPSQLANGKGDAASTEATADGTDGGKDSDAAVADTNVKANDQTATVAVDPVVTVTDADGSGTADPSGQLADAAKAEAAKKEAEATSGEQPVIATNLHGTVTTGTGQQAAATTDVVDATEATSEGSSEENSSEPTSAKSASASPNSAADSIIAKATTDATTDNGSGDGSDKQDRSKDTTNVAVAQPQLTAVNASAGETSGNSGSATGAIGSNPQSPRLPAPLLGKSEGTAHPRPVAEVDITRFVHRVARAFEAAQQRDGEVRLRLSPPELGSVRLSMTVQDGVMVAKLETETTTAQALISDNLQALRDRLQEQGIRVERFDVDLMNQSPGGFANPQDQATRDPDANGLLRGGPRVGSAAPTPTDSRGRSTTPLDGTSGLNVVV